MTAAPSGERPRLKPGSVVRCRTRSYLVEDVQPPMHRKLPEGGDRALTLACLEDAISQQLTMFLVSEVDFELLIEIDALKNPDHNLHLQVGDVRLAGGGTLNAVAGEGSELLAEAPALSPMSRIHLSPSSLDLSPRRITPRAEFSSDPNRSPVIHDPLQA
jgi:hypothetical protein